MLDVVGLCVDYGTVRALHGVSLSIAPGEIVSLIGANGAGKSTLVNAVSGILVPSAGQVMFEGDDLVGTAAHRIARRGIAHVPEGRRIFPGLTVGENLNVALSSRKDRTEVEDDRAYVHRLFPVLYKQSHQRGWSLSGGEQQMLAIGRALMSRPKLLILDEPSLGLAPLVAGAVLRAVAELQARGITILLIEQNARAALRIADRGYVLERGRIVLSGTGKELARSETVRRVYLGA
ncbi:MAG: ABC transporter ATP-binding protein [Acidimicrobiales bacterium]